MQSLFTGVSVPFEECWRPSHGGQSFMFVVGPSGVSLLSATTAGVVALLRVIFGGKKVGATAPVKHALFCSRNPSNLPPSWHHVSFQPQWCLTPRSRRGPTSKHQAREAAQAIIRIAGLAFCCRSRLSSNVRHHKDALWPFSHQEQPSAVSSAVLAPVLC